MPGNLWMHEAAQKSRRYEEHRTFSARNLSVYTARCKINVRPSAVTQMSHRCSNESERSIHDLDDCFIASPVRGRLMHWECMGLGEESTYATVYLRTCSHKNEITGHGRAHFRNFSHFCNP